MNKIDNNQNYTNILNKIFAGIIVVIALLLVNTIVLLSTTSDGKTTDKTTETTEEETNSDYDVSMFKSVTVEETLALFDTKGTYLLYVGREDCSACVAYLPILQEAQTNLGYTTYYLNLYDVDTSKTSEATINKLLKKFTFKTTAKVSDESKTGTFGDTFWGVTPMTIIIKDGKNVDGLLGAYPYEKLETLINKYNIGK